MLHDAVFNHEADEEAKEAFEDEAEEQYYNYQEEEEGEWNYMPEYQEEEESGAKTVDIEVSETLEDRSLEQPMLMDALDFEHAEEVEETNEIVQRNRPRPNQQQQQQQQGQQQQGQQQHQQDRSNHQNSQSGATHVELELADFQCLTCNAVNTTQCAAEGTYETCFVGQTCHFELREKNGIQIQVIKGCKQEHSCHDQRKQNFTNGKRHHQQCRPGHQRGPSVCRKCCKTENCTENFDTSVRSNWWTN